jgi:6-phosphogluconolactonase
MTLPVIHRFPNAAALAKGTAELVLGKLGAAITRKGTASIALAGGSTPRALHRELTGAQLEWQAVHVWFGDERCVSPDDPASNYRMACESLLDHVRLLPDHVHRIEGQLAPPEAAARYADQLAVALPFDVIVLGMGDDGHTASLFPETPAPPKGALAFATKSPVPPHERVTLTLDAIRTCETVILLVSGAGKAARLAQVYAELAEDRPHLPAASIGPAIWMIDEGAAVNLPR